MKNASSQLLAHLAQHATTTCLCVRIVRQDGTVLGFTNHNRPFSYTFITNPDSVGSVVYSPTSAQSSSSIKAAAGTGVDVLELVGAITSSSLTDTDLRGDKYQAAKVVVFTVNWADLTMGEMIELTGSIGEVNLTDFGYKAEVLSLESNLKRYQGEVTCALCRVKRFGDLRCKFNVAPYTDLYTITSVTDSVTFTASGTPTSGLVGSRTSDWYAFGVVHGLSGSNNGVLRSAKNSTFVSYAGPGNPVFNSFLLKEAFPFAINVGDTFNIEVGCDRTFTSCKNKFNNAVNFRGEPYLPGNLRIIQTGRPNG